MIILDKGVTGTKYQIWVLSTFEVMLSIQHHKTTPKLSIRPSAQRSGSLNHGCMETYFSTIETINTGPGKCYLIYVTNGNSYRTTIDSYHTWSVIRIYMLLNSGPC